MPLALIGILLVSRLVDRMQKPAGSAKKKPRSSKAGSATGGSKVQLKNAPQDIRPGAPLSAEERDAMLDGVKNLARENPKKVAGLLRNWMEEDEPR